MELVGRQEKETAVPRFQDHHTTYQIGEPMNFNAEKPEPGRIYPNISNEEYHRCCGISKSGLALLRKTPAHYAAKYIYGAEEPPTPAMIIGSAFHTMVLQEELFSDEYAVAPVCDRRTKAGKAEYETFVGNAEGKTVISLEDYERIQNMTSAVCKHPGAYMLLNMSTAVEESFFWIDETTGTLCKCRPDLRIASKRILVDLKSCEDASPEAFARTIYNFTYHLQAGFYCDGVSQVLQEQYSTFIFIAVEKKPPYAVAVYQLDPDAIDAGKREAADLLRLFAWCSERNEWPGYPEEIQTITMPRWAQSKEVTIYD